MKEDAIGKEREKTKDWSYPQELHTDCNSFKRDVEVHIHDDMYDLFTYENKALHKKAVAYFHEETHEYKLRVSYGLITFCRIEYITSKLEVFEQQLRKELERTLADMAEFNPESISSIVRDKEIMTWDVAQRLPQELEGFQLFVRPDKPAKITNGSYIIIDYVDFTYASSFTAYYNIFRDEFFAEARIWNIPDVTYDFDSHELPELERLLHEKLVPRLQEIRRRAIAEKDEVHYT